MRRSKSLMQLTWILVIALVLMPLFTFISCADDIVGPKTTDDNPDAPKEEEQDPNTGSGSGGGGMAMSQEIIHIHYV